MNNSQKNNMYKDALNLTLKYKGVMLDVDGIRLSSVTQEELEERLLAEAKFQLDDLKYGGGNREDLELQGYTEKQAERMVKTAIKHLERFLDKYEPD